MFVPGSNRVSSGDGVADENLLLRRHLRKQEEKIKLLATKLVRVVGERKSKVRDFAIVLPRSLIN